MKAKRVIGLAGAAVLAAGTALMGSSSAFAGQVHRHSHCPPGYHCINVKDLPVIHGNVNACTLPWSPGTRNPCGD